MLRQDHDPWYHVDLLTLNICRHGHPSHIYSIVHPASRCRTMTEQRAGHTQTEISLLHALHKLCIFSVFFYFVEVMASLWHMAAMAERPFWSK